MNTQIHIKGSKDVLERAVLANQNGTIPGSRMSTEWRAGQSYGYECGYEAPK